MQHNTQLVIYNKNYIVICKIKFLAQLQASSIPFTYLFSCWQMFLSHFCRKQTYSERYLDLVSSSATTIQHTIYLPI